jgi:hypothetical protein
VIRAHQPGSEPIDIPETIPNPVVVPKPPPTPTEPAPASSDPGEGARHELPAAGNGADNRSRRSGHRAIVALAPSQIGAAHYGAHRQGLQNHRRSTCRIDEMPPPF